MKLECDKRREREEKIGLIICYILVILFIIGVIIAILNMGKILYFIKCEAIYSEETMSEKYPEKQDHTVIFPRTIRPK